MKTGGDVEKKAFLFVNKLLIKSKGQYNCGMLYITKSCLIKDKENMESSVLIEPLLIH